MIDSIDIKALLDEHNISYRGRGKNVSKGWLGLEICPFCGDSAFHCGVRDTGFHCWVCGTKGHIGKLLREMDAFKGRKIDEILLPFVREGMDTLPKPESDPQGTLNRSKTGSLTLPNGILEDLPVPHRNYLISRGFDPDFLMAKYHLKAVYNTGTQKYRFRIIAPVFMNGRMVSFMAAAITRSEGTLKYLSSSAEESIVPVSQCLYNYDSIKDVAVIVEGITDVWRMGDGFVASFRTTMTPEQILLLSRKKPKKVFIMYDADAGTKAKALADMLRGIFPLVEILEIDEGDPADFTFEEAQKIRAVIFR